MTEDGEEFQAAREARNSAREERAVVREEREIMRDERGEDTRGRLSSARRQVRTVVGAIILLAVIALGFMVVLFWPYSPMTIHSYEVSPSASGSSAPVCPGELLTTNIDYSVEEGAFIDRVESQVRWTAVDVAGVDVGQVWEGDESVIIDASQIRSGRQQVHGSVLRPAPDIPGVWRFGVELVVHGELPTQNQRLTPQARETTTVLPLEHSSCGGGV